MSQFPDDRKLVTRDARRSERLTLECRARIRIGNRQYAGYIDNLSEGGARITTFTPIQGEGKVVLRLPDLPAIRGALRWRDGTAAGVAFGLTLSREYLLEWARSRLNHKA
jgi:hypothetical protein